MHFENFARKNGLFRDVPDEQWNDWHWQVKHRVETLEDVVGISVRVQEFCLERGIDRRRAHIAALALEEMAGNVIDHGFKKDKKKHRVDVRVVHKDDDVILRIRDDCIPFDPGERAGIIDPEDPAKNIGIRMVFKTARDVKYRNMFGFPKQILYVFESLLKRAA